MNPIPARIEGQLIGALGNLNFCESVCEFLVECKGYSIPTELRMVGSKRTVVLSGENCGFVTNQIIHGAILDIRRLVPFLGLAYSQKQDCLTAIKEPTWVDDYWIGDLGLKPTTPMELDAVAETVCGAKAMTILRGPLIYSNKQMAHFSKAEGEPEFEDLRNSCRLLVSAVMIFVYDALSLPHPSMHFRHESH